MTNLSALTDALTPLFKRRTVADWLQRLEEAGVPAGPVLDIAQMHADPQALAREMIVETTHPVAGHVKAIGLPIKFSDTPGGVYRPAPVFGEHTREVLREQNYSEKEIDRMLDQGAIQTPESTKKGATR
jgi:crotonobetainyl-CoA:carnitine CoA-transferase CaiB-like acyl-CoA transferase